MPPAQHPDATGYLNDLSREVDTHWFRMVCDLAVSSDGSPLDRCDIDTLSALFKSDASYVGSTQVAAHVQPAPVPTTERLDVLTDFSNFKLLQDTLQADFTKRLTILFGTNGSGKSSLCEALKILANPEQSKRPLHNARTGTTQPPPTFSYKFSSDQATQVWTQADGFGVKESTVKYFDTQIAVKNLKDSLEPRRVIELSPFRLHVFENARDIVTELRDYLQRHKAANAAVLSRGLETVRAAFAGYKTFPLSTITEKSLPILSAEASKGLEYVQQGQHLRLELLHGGLTEFLKAGTEDGLRLLKSEKGDIDSLKQFLDEFITTTELLVALKPSEAAKERDEKTAALKLLADALIPGGATLDGLLALLKSASALSPLDGSGGNQCPLCKRELGEPEAALFTKYHNLLTNRLEAEIEALKATIARAAKLYEKILGAAGDDWSRFVSLQGDMLADAKRNAGLIATLCANIELPTAEVVAALGALRGITGYCATLSGQKAAAIESGEKNKDDFQRQVAVLKAEIEPLAYASTILAHVDMLRSLRTEIDEYDFWNTSMPVFVQALKKITDKAKLAYEELVVADFETRLNNEYLALAEKFMDAFGVKLAKKGADAAMTVLPKIGGHDINGVLSEGELRLHALALFFAELETCAHPVIIFDDPVSSFDYNYITNYCLRLRNFLVTHPARQIVVLTHNWEFFVQLQTTINQAQLSRFMSVQVLENCAVVDEYSENVTTLKDEITRTLATPGEPTRSQKEILAGKIRRLIESIVNTHVFDNQRHQFKQKGQKVSEFQLFTKLVPLQLQEALDLKDLFSKHSTSEHDDPRNNYMIADKAMFQTRYDQILRIESALIARKP